MEKKLIKKGVISKEYWLYMIVNIICYSETSKCRSVKKNKKILQLWNYFLGSDIVLSFGS